MKESSADSYDLCDWLWGNWLLFCASWSGSFVYNHNRRHTDTAFWIHHKKDNLGAHSLKKQGIQRSRNHTFLPGLVYGSGILCGKRQYCGCVHSRAGRRHGSVSSGCGWLPLWEWLPNTGEIILGMLYREKNEEGNYVGGPMYYIKRDCTRPGWLCCAPSSW